VKWVSLSSLATSTKPHERYVIRLRLGTPRSAAVYLNCLRSFGCEVEPIDSVLVDCVDERPRPAACSCDADQVVKEAGCHVGTAEVPVRQTEAAHSVSLHGISFGPVVPDPGVLHEYRPSVAPGELQPLGVSNVFVVWDAVVLGEGGQAKSGGAEEGGDFDATETAIQEEVRQPVWM
jgi:hypothetical protein